MIEHTKAAGADPGNFNGAGGGGGGRAIAKISPGSSRPRVLH